MKVPPFLEKVSAFVSEVEDRDLRGKARWVINAITVLYWEYVCHHGTVDTVGGIADMQGTYYDDGATFPVLRLEWVYPTFRLCFTMRDDDPKNTLDWDIMDLISEPTKGLEFSGTVSTRDDLDHVILIFLFYIFGHNQGAKGVHYAVIMDNGLSYEEHEVVEVHVAHSEEEAREYVDRAKAHLVECGNTTDKEEIAQNIENAFGIVPFFYDIKDISFSYRKVGA